MLSVLFKEGHDPNSFVEYFINKNSVPKDAGFVTRYNTDINFNALF